MTSSSFWDDPKKRMIHIQLRESLKKKPKKAKHVLKHEMVHALRSLAGVRKRTRVIEEIIAERGAGYNPILATLSATSQVYPKTVGGVVGVTAGVVTGGVVLGIDKINKNQKL